MTPPPPPEPVVLPSPSWVDLPSQWPGQLDLLQWCRDMGPGTAALLILLGIVYLLFGYYLFKALVTLNAALFGAWVGAVLGQKVNAAAAGAFLVGFTVAAITWPLMQYAVAIMGGMYGALLGASIWNACGLAPIYAWSGGLIGLVFFGMLSFILFRGSIMMYMSLQGAVMLVFGVLGLVYKYQDLAPQITNGMTARPIILPMAIFIPAILGLIYQQANFPAKEEGD